MTQKMLQVMIGAEDNHALMTQGHDILMICADGDQDMMTQKTLK